MSALPQLVPQPHRLPPVPWRTPNSVSPAKLQGYIHALEKACQEDPMSADLRTCLGMAQALNYDVYKAKETFEQAIALDTTHFFARIKYAELFCRLHVLSRAEDETLKALNVAHNAWEFNIARKQLSEIRYLLGDSRRQLSLQQLNLGPALAGLALLVLFLILSFR